MGCLFSVPSAERMRYNSAVGRNSKLRDVLIPITWASLFVNAILSPMLACACLRSWGKGEAALVTCAAIAVRLIVATFREEPAGFWWLYLAVIWSIHPIIETIAWLYWSA
jgi:hypothetical protein